MKCHRILIVSGDRYSESKPIVSRSLCKLLRSLEELQLSDVVFWKRRIHTRNVEPELQSEGHG